MNAIGLCVLLAAASSSPSEGSESSTTPHGTRFDVLIFAPHPDDEVLGCAGVILQTLEEEKKVGVVLLTNGDGYPKAAAVVSEKPQDKLVPADFLQLGGTRQQQSIDGVAHLGLGVANLVFLGYPDSGLKQIYTTEEGGPYRQKFTRKNETYGVVVTDYHSLRHGRPGPYTKASILADIMEIIQQHKPQEIYVTHEADTHGDHSAAFWFVRDAAVAGGFGGTLYAYINHGNTQPDLPVRPVSLTPEQLKKKRLAIREHQIPIVHDHLQSYARPEEVFWKVPIK